jgi:hypothetical protein
MTDWGDVQLENELWFGNNIGDTYTIMETSFPSGGDPTVNDGNLIFFGITSAVAFDQVTLNWTYYDAFGIDEVYYSAASTLKGRWKIEFDMMGYYRKYDTVAADWVEADASANLTGNLKTRGSMMYLSPLKGTITINGTENKIKSNLVVNSSKQSEPLAYYEYQTVDEDGNNWRFERYYMYIDANAEGSKYNGYLVLEKRYMNGSFHEERSLLRLQGIVDGEMVSCAFWGNYPPMD